MRIETINEKRRNRNRLKKQLKKNASFKAKYEEVKKEAAKFRRISREFIKWNDELTVKNITLEVAIKLLGTGVKRVRSKVFVPDEFSHKIDNNQFYIYTSVSENGRITFIDFWRK